jgi:putative signal transducing protein
MYCPECGAEYREGFTECSDCHVALRAGAPPDASVEFDPKMDLVVVLETNDRVQAAMAKGLLEDAGIPFFVLGQITGLVNDVDGFIRKWLRIQVPRDREAEAREVLEQVLQPVTDAEALGEDGGHNE